MIEIIDILALMIIVDQEAEANHVTDIEVIKEDLPAETEIDLLHPIPMMYIL